jgi:hypothetical protein
MELYHKIMKLMNDEDQTEEVKTEESKFDSNKCSNCGGVELEVEGVEKACIECGAIDSHYAVFMTEDFRSCLNHSRYVYTRASYFKKWIQRYQGTQNCNIPDNVYDKLNNAEITRTIIIKCLKDLNYNKHYKNTHKIYYELTGKMIDDIEYLEYDLVNDYREFTRVYKTLKVDRKNFINVQYILYHLLKRRGHSCDVENFSLPKTKGSRIIHDELCKKVFETLGWEFIAIK